MSNSDWRSYYYNPAFFVLNIFGSIKQAGHSHGQNAQALSYSNFTIKNYKSIKTLTVELPENKLVSLLGLNESGKTTILKAIENFDFRNDPKDEAEMKRMFTGIRNKQKTYSDDSAKITAKIIVNEKIKDDFLWLKIKAAGMDNKISEDDATNFINEMNNAGEINISRVIPFDSGNPQASYYEIDIRNFSVSEVMKEKDVMAACALIIISSLCPYIIYFEDFQDIVPDKIYTDPKNGGYVQDWYDIIEGLFYDADQSQTVGKFIELYNPKNPRETDAETVLKKINNNLNKKFTKQWKTISGVKDISTTEIKFIKDGPRGQYFQILVGDKGGTMYEVKERSRGAVWYISFLMKTEFRRRKMRSDAGKLVYLIDEPASNLHSRAQQNMLKDFSKLAKDAYVIYTTHSQYLVSPEHMKTMFVVNKSKGKLECLRLSDYMKYNQSQVSYYQPISDCLKIRPHFLDNPWPNVLIVEGTSDMIILDVMYHMAMKKEPNFVIYPAGGAHTMAVLISLNYGWGATTRVLLDSDSPGIAAQSEYKKKFELQEICIINFPDGVKTIEKMFDSESMLELWNIVYGEKIKNLQKKKYHHLFISIKQDEKLLSSARNIIGEATISKFEKLFESMSF